MPTHSAPSAADSTAPRADTGTASSPAARRSTEFYAPALDGLRCFAVLGVLIFHFSPTLGEVLETGSWGVRLFFVLSGFLITRSLLQTRKHIDAGQTSVPSALRAFFIRRLFRLWPVYFLCLAIAYAFNIELTRQTIWWHLLMASNQYVFHTQSWPGVLSHFWTLAVEQQFYLFWPFVILFAAKRRMDLVLLAVLVAGPLSRELILAMRWSNLATLYTPLPCCLDFFAIGGAVAWGHDEGWLDRFATTLRLRLLLMLAAGWLLWGTLLKYIDGHYPAHWLVYDPLLQALGFAALIVYLLHRPGGLIGRCLRFRPFVYLGEISYGIYIFHNFSHRFGPGLLRHTAGMSYFPDELPHVLYYTALSFTAAVVSHHFFEKPVRRWGRRLA